MPTPTNKALYAKSRAKYAGMKHSAYKSSLVVKDYKSRGGGYSGAKPTKRITKDTPTTMSELSKARKKKAIAEKKAKGRVKKY
mgnify:CR=1 FL=1